MLKKIAFVTVTATSMMIAAAQTPAVSPVAKTTESVKAAPAKTEHKMKTNKVKTEKHAVKKVEKEANTAAPKLEAK
ncbi:hypothetical protein [Neisseria sp. Ec49-e6-T10]|uniref:hypothetical protein n=1 Tax=Neisseria sp. Ec49-e6-T10 TaxID=3140744 RepID=UPI003EBCC2C9